MADRVTLTGLDGSRPLGFLEALGVLRALSEDAAGRGAPPPRLQWRRDRDAVWRPVLHGVSAMQELIDRLLAYTAIFSASGAQIGTGLAAEHFHVALLGPEGDGPPESAPADRSQPKRGRAAGAAWLAFLGRGLLPRAGRKDSDFVWPLWIVPASQARVRSLLRSPHLPSLGPRELAVLGIRVVFTSQGESARRPSHQMDHGHRSHNP